MKKIFLSVLMALTLAAIEANAQPKGLNVNDKAPNFSAKDQNGKLIDLKKVIQKGPVVLVFYRGYWCPYCNKHLKNLEDSLGLLSAKGATVIAVSPEKPENIQQTVTKTGAAFSILFDEGLKIMKAYDVAFAVDSATIKSYKKYGLDFTKINGETNGTNLPVPAVYIIGQNGEIKYRHFDENYTRRASVATLLEHL